MKKMKWQFPILLIMILLSFNILFAQENKKKEQPNKLAVKTNTQQYQLTAEEKDQYYLAAEKAQTATNESQNAPQKEKKSTRSNKSQLKVEDIVSDLTAEQKDQLATYAKEYKENTKEWRKKLKETTMELKKLKETPNANEDEVYKKIDEVADLRTKLGKENFAYKKKIEKILTPKQQEELKEKQKDMEGKRVNKNPNDKKDH